MERVTTIEDPSSKLATQIAKDIESLTGGHEWSGDNPYEIQMVDSKEQKGFIYQIRKSDDWVTIQEQVSDNPLLVQTFLLEKKGNSWVYVDASLKKHGVSSLPNLQTAYERLQVTMDSSSTSPLTEPRKELP